MMRHPFHPRRDAFVAIQFSTPLAALQRGVHVDDSANNNRFAA
jgi:hypothetical protein